jgi:small-conductance mechanosensitive channel
MYRVIASRSSTWQRVRVLSAAALIMLTALAAGHDARAAESVENKPAAAPVTSPSTAAPAQLVIANRTIVTLRAEVHGASPHERAMAVEERVATVVDQGGPLEVTEKEIPEGVAIMVDGRVAFRVLDADVDVEVGESARDVSARAAQNLQMALDEMREARDSRAILLAIGISLVATVVLLGVLWLLVRLYRWAARRIEGFASRRSERLAQTLGHQTIGQLGLVRLAVAPVRLLAILVGLLVAYEWLGLVLKQFPYTRPWGETLLGGLLGALGVFVLAVLKAVPGLLFVLFIFLVARFVVRALRVFFAGVEQGRVHVPWVDETTARPTGQLLAAVVWLFALVAAYPYLPGSGSEAFKGIGVFLGLMLSIGSSGVVNQAVSGLMLMYTRSFRPGEFVQVGDTEGTVREIGFLTTTIETLRHEHITIPNAVIVGNVTRNLSRLKERGGVRVPTTVTIGYDAPWRQVQAMLRDAAGRTTNVLADPPPRILQTALLDHAVEYTMLVSIAEPAVRPLALDELHANIQDVFNEHGVQIMSPRYEADPVQAKVVPPGEWFKAPAAPPTGP